MKNEIYMSVMILNYGDGKELCQFAQQIDDDELEVKEIPHAEACRLMWELVLAGGKRDFGINMFDRTITRCGACYIAAH